jgi:uncharacterized protein (DUF1015 family)
MPELRPFRGIRYRDSARLKDLVCPPFDVISPAEQRRLHELDPHNAVHLELSNAHENRIERNKIVATTFERWLAESVLERDAHDSLYVYRQDFSAADGRRHRVAGVIGALELEPFGISSGVLPHERTMPGPIEDRLALLRALPVNISPIYAIYRGAGGLAPFLDSLTNRPTEARLSDEHGILHRLWTVGAPAEIAMISEALRPGPLVIADGHHRYETALAYRADEPGDDARASIMCFCVDVDVEDIVVLPYHRALRTHVESQEIKRRLGERWPLEPVTGEFQDALRRSSADHPFVLRFPTEEVLVEVGDEDVVARVGARSKAWRDLDVVALHEVVLPQALPDGADLVFSKDRAEIERLVDEEGWTAGVLLRGLAPTQVVDVAQSGERMPQKASYFWPKAVTGLVFRPLGGEPANPAMERAAKSAKPSTS